MRRDNLITLCLFLGISALVFNSQASFATDPKVIQSFLSEGDIYLNQNNAQAALGSYSRGFLLDPHNKELLNRLLALTYEERLSISQQYQLIQLNDLITYLNTISAKAHYYIKKIKEIKSYLIERGVDKDIIELEIKLAERKVERSYAKRLDKLKKLYLEKEEPLDMVNASLEQSKLIMLMKVEVITEQFNRLKMLNKEEVPSRDLLVRQVDLNRLAQGQIRSTFPRPQPSSFDLEQENKLEQLSNNVVELSLLLQESKTRIEKQDKQIAFLKDSLSGVKSQKDLGGHILDEKNDEILSLNQKIIDLQSQLALRKRIVREKEDNLKQSKDRTVNSALELTQENEMLKKVVKTQKRGIRQLEAMLDVYQTKEGSEVIQNELAHAKQINQLTIEKFKEIVDLRDTTINQKNNQINELSNILELYQTMLKESKDDYLASKKKIDKIDIEFEKLKLHLSEKSRILLDTEYKLMTLKKDLTKVQSRLLALKNIDDTKNYAQLDGKIEELDEELDSIHTFLLQQLSDFEKLNKDFIAGNIEDIDKVLNLKLDRIEQD